jgi:exopolyphosphatase / guanosine-5'-triphosphate,3'-diphosphate pyrophosphatase
MDIAVIDIGTNTAMLLLAHIENGRVTPLHQEQRTPRLGAGVDSSGFLSPDAIDRVLKVLHEYKSLCQHYSLASVLVAGTSAVRDARNRNELAAVIKKVMGVDLEVLSGEEEAIWTYRGAVSGLESGSQTTVIDIGGGSTEITTGSGRDIAHRLSLQLGSVRLTERFLRHQPPTEGELIRAVEYIRGELRPLDRSVWTNSLAVGVAGTATSLAILAQDLPDFSSQAVAGYTLTRPTVERLYGVLRRMTSPDIQRQSAVMDGRSDIITAGTLLLLEIMEYCNFERVIVSERGIRFGLALREWERQTSS